MIAGGASLRIRGIDPRDLRSITATCAPPASGADDTAALQACLNEAGTASNGVVLAAAGQTYIVSKAGTAPASVPSGETMLGVSLRIPSGVTFDLNGSTLLASSANGSDFAMISNADMNTGAHDVGLVNGVLDHNDTASTATATLTLINVNRPTIRGVRFVRCKRAAFQSMKITGSIYDQLEATNVDGNAFNLGHPAKGFREVGGRWGTFTAFNVAAWSTNPTNFPGNPFYTAAHMTDISAIIATDCAAGVKVGYPSSDVNIGRVLISNDGHGVGNSGLKLQGDTLGGVERITVGMVNASGCAGVGLYVDDNTHDCVVGSYVGAGNGRLGTWPDVWIAGPRTTITTLSSTGAGQAAVEVRGNATDCHVGRAVIRNSGQVVGAASGASSGWNQTASTLTGIHVSSLVIRDDQIVPTMRRGVNVGSAATLAVDTAFISGDFAVSAMSAAPGSSVRVSNLNGVSQ